MTFGIPTKQSTEFDVQMADGSRVTIAATASTIRSGCLLLGDAHGWTHIYARGTWVSAVRKGVARDRGAAG